MCIPKPEEINVIYSYDPNYIGVTYYRRHGTYVYVYDCFSQNNEHCYAFVCDYTIEKCDVIECRQEIYHTQESFIERLKCIYGD